MEMRIQRPHSTIKGGSPLVPFSSLIKPLGYVPVYHIHRTGNILYNRISDLGTLSHVCGSRKTSPSSIETGSI